MPDRGFLGDQRRNGDTGISPILPEVPVKNRVKIVPSERLVLKHDFFSFLPLLAASQEEGVLCPIQNFLEAEASDFYRKEKNIPRSGQALCLFVNQDTVALIFEASRIHPFLNGWIFFYFTISTGKKECLRKMFDTIEKIPTKRFSHVFNRRSEKGIYERSAQRSPIVAMLLQKTTPSLPKILLHLIEVSLFL